MNGRDRSVIRAIRGPITLITVGVLFALNNFTQYRFGKTWPVILIVFGLLSLLRRGTEPEYVAPPPGYAYNTPPTQPYQPTAAPPYNAPPGRGSYHPQTGEFIPAPPVGTAGPDEPPAAGGKL
jgi:hypothetical protein